jgi:DNA-binding CsgD family transcriptional regulator
MPATLFDRLRELRLDAWQLRYGFALMTVGVAWASRERFLPDATERSPFVVFGLAILITSLLAGFGPGIVATAISSFIAVLFYLPPYVALAVHAPFDLALLLLFVLEGGVAAIGGGAVRAAIRRQDTITGSTARFARFIEQAEVLRGQWISDGPPLVESLTPRELEVARLLALGLTNEELSKAMYVSLNTVKTHLKRLYDKLGVQTRTEAVARCIELGIFENAPEGDAARYVAARQHDRVQGGATRPE